MNTILATALLALLAARPASVGEDLSAYFPSEAGRIWRYTTNKRSLLTAGSEVRKSDKRGVITDAVRGPSKYGIAITRVVYEKNSTMGDVRVESVLHYRITPQAVSGMAMELPSTNVVVPYSPPQPVLLRHIPGPRVESALGSLRLTTQLLSQRLSQTTTAMATFADCIVTETAGPVSGTFNGAAVRNGSIVVQQWYARGVGLVREERMLRFVVVATQGPIAVEESATKLLENTSVPRRPPDRHH